MLHMLALQMGDEVGGGGGGIGGAIGGLVSLAIAVFLVASVWKVFTKAGEPGWAAIIPIYNAIVLLKIVGRPVWWFVLMLVPLVSIVIAFIVIFDVAKSFGKGAGFAIGLLLVPFIFWPMLGFGDARYQGPSA